MFFVCVPRLIPYRMNIFNRNLNFDISVYFVFVYQGTYLTQIKVFNKKYNFDN